MGRGTLCITHGEDADGLICAAYLKHLFGAAIKLVSYDDLKEALAKVQPPTEELYICDLNVRDELRGEVLRISKFAKVTIVDHHPTAEAVLGELGKRGVNIVCSPLDCASALLYDFLKERLSREAARLAAYAAISDQFEDGPIASRLLNMFDRLFVQHEALILTHALSSENSADFKSLVVEELSRFTLPHRIKGAVDAALAHLDNVAKLIKTLPTKASRLHRLAYVETTNETSLGAIANLILDSTDVSMGVSYKKLEDGTVNVSLRCRKGLEIHLGEATKRVAEKHHGFGGGHSRASGANIPQRNLIAFISDIEAEMMEDKSP